jgi:hypothetical protein
MRIAHLITPIIFILVANVSNGQTYMIDSTGKKVMVKQTIVHSRPPESEEIPQNKPHQDFNTMKAGLLYFVSGCIPVYYERKVLPWLSVQGGIGLTTRDFVADVVNIVLEGYNVNEGLNPYYRYNERKSLVGVYASLQPKFYIHNNALDGFWFGPTFEFKQYNYKANLADVNSLPDDYGNPVYLSNKFQREYRNAVDATFNVGWQFKYNRLCLEYSMGVGFRRFWEKRSDVESYSTATGIAPYFTNGVRTYSGYRPEINMALSFGGFF